MNFVRLVSQGQGRVGQKQVLQVMVQVIGLLARRFAGDLMGVDDQWQIMLAVPGMQRQTTDAGFLDGFPCR